MSYKRPHFTREESWRYKRVKESWRSPRGKTSRVRRSKEGWPPVVKIGYARPKSIRGRHPCGLDEVIVFRPEDLEHINPKTQVARIAHTVGENKRVQILDQAKKANIRVLNPRVKKEAEVPAAAAAEAPTEPTVGAETQEPIETGEGTPTSEEAETEETEEQPEMKDSASTNGERANKK